MRMDPAVAAIRLAVREGLADLTKRRSRPRRGQRRRRLARAGRGAGSGGTAAGAAGGAVTVDHGLQEGSTERAADVAATCEDLGLDPVVVETRDGR